MQLPLLIEIKPVCDQHYFRALGPLRRSLPTAETVIGECWLRVLLRASVLDIAQHVWQCDDVDNTCEIRHQ